MNKYLIPALLIIAIGAIAFFGGRGCARKDVGGNDVVKMPAETARKSVVTGRALKDKELAVDTLRYLAANKALQREITYWKGKYTTETVKGAKIEERYLKNKNVATADTLLANKDERIADLVGEIAEHRKDSLNKETLLKIQVAHIKDRNLRIDSLSAGWQEANLNAAQWEKKAKRRGKIIAVGAAIIGAGVAGAVLAR